MSPITIVTAPPIDTLAELRRQNSALLQRNVAGTGTNKPTVGELLGFLEAAAKLGRSLEDLDARETAQGIMDVWIAELLSLDAHAGDVSRPFTLEDHDISTAKLAADDARQLRVDAEAAVQRVDTTLPTPLVDKDNVQQRLLLRFIRLKEKSLEAYSVPLAAEDDILKEPAIKTLLNQYIQAGVIKPQEQGGYVLAHESLISTWPLLQDFVTQRKAFRQVARGWEDGGRNTEALITKGTQLQHAIDYPHLDTSEHAFLEASRRSGEKKTRVKNALLTTALLVVTCLLVWVYSKNGELERSQAETQHELAIANTSASVIRSIRDLLSLRTPLGNAMAEHISTVTGATLGQPHKLTPGRHSMEVFVALNSDLHYLDGIQELLNAEGYDLPAGSPLPRTATSHPTVIRTFYESDRALARKLANLLASALTQIMPASEVSQRLGKLAANKSEQEQRTLLAQPQHLAKVLMFDDENDPTAPEGFLQVVIDAKTIPTVK